MEVEREKKEKLASARKKLNEYKMNRSSGIIGRYPVPVATTATAVSSKPADVPLFYQNINSPAASINIFNPAAAQNNNDQANPTYFSPTLPSVFDTQTTSDNVTTFSIQGGSHEGFPVMDGTKKDTAPNPFALSAGLGLGASIACNTFTTSVGHTSTNEILTTSTTGGVDQEPNQNFFQPIKQTDSVVGNLGQNALFENVSLSAFEDDAVPKDLPCPLPLENSINSFPLTSEPGDQNPLLSAPSLNGKSTFPPSAPPLDISENTEAHLLHPSFKPESVTGLPDVSDKTEDEKQSLVLGEIATSKEDDHNLVSGLDPGVQSNETDSNPVFASSLFYSADRDTEHDNFFHFGGNKSSSLTSPPELINTFISPEAVFHTNPFVSPPEQVSSSENQDIGATTKLDPSAKSSDEPGEKFPVGVENATFGGSHPRPFANVDEIVDSSESIHLMAADSTAATSAEVEVLAPSNEEVTNMMHLETEMVAAAISPEDLQIHRQGSDEPLSLQSQTRVENSPTVSVEAIQQMRAVQDALELQIEELRRENNYLINRQTEHTTRLEESEKLTHEFKLDRDRIKEESMTTSQALRGKINSLCEENQRIVKNSTDIGVDLRAKLEEKSRQLEEMQKAVIIVSQSKMDFAERLDHEVERVKELQTVIQQKDAEISSLRSKNADLLEKDKQEQQKDAVIYQLQDQNRHYQVQNETLQKELSSLRKRIKAFESYSSGPPPQASTSQGPTDYDKPSGDEVAPNISLNDSSISSPDSVFANESLTKSDDPDKSPENAGRREGLHVRDHGVGECGHGHHDHEVHSHHHNENHIHHHHSHEYVHDHNHGGNHSHDHDHSNHDHHHELDHDHDSLGVGAHPQHSDEVTEMKKTLHRLQWENSTFRNEIDILVVDAKEKRDYEDKCASLQEENNKLKKEVEQLEHVIIQLQGENDTIGDYITLYQSQKLALKECAKEKDAQLELLAREREMLLHRLTELTALVKDLKDSKSESGSQCADDHMHSLEVLPPSTAPKSKRQIEGKIRDLLTEISSSTLIENFHPCAVCSGQLMTV